MSITKKFFNLWRNKKTEEKYEIIDFPNWPSKNNFPEYTIISGWTASEAHRIAALQIANLIHSKEIIYPQQVLIIAYNINELLIFKKQLSDQLKDSKEYWTDELDFKTYIEAWDEWIRNNESKIALKELDKYKKAVFVIGNISNVEYEIDDIALKNLFQDIPTFFWQYEKNNMEDWEELHCTFINKKDLDFHPIAPHPEEQTSPEKELILKQLEQAKKQNLPLENFCIQLEKQSDKAKYQLLILKIFQKKFKLLLDWIEVATYSSYDQIPKHLFQSINSIQYEQIYIQHRKLAKYFIEPIQKENNIKEIFKLIGFYKQPHSEICDEFLEIIGNLKTKQLLKSIQEKIQIHTKEVSNKLIKVKIPTISYPPTSNYALSLINKLTNSKLENPIKTGRKPILFVANSQEEEIKWIKNQLVQIWPATILIYENTSSEILSLERLFPYIEIVKMSEIKNRTWENILIPNLNENFFSKYHLQLLCDSIYSNTGQLFFSSDSQNISSLLDPIKELVTIKTHPKKINNYPQTSNYALSLVNKLTNSKLENPNLEGTKAVSHIANSTQNEIIWLSSKLTNPSNSLIIIASDKKPENYELEKLFPKIKIQLIDEIDNITWKNIFIIQLNSDFNSSTHFQLFCKAILKSSDKLFLSSNSQKISPFLEKIKELTTISEIKKEEKQEDYIQTIKNKIMHSTMEKPRTYIAHSQEEEIKWVEKKIKSLSTATIITHSQTHWQITCLKQQFPNLEVINISETNLRTWENVFITNLNRLFSSPKDLQLLKNSILSCSKQIFFSNNTPYISPFLKQILNLTKVESLDQINLITRTYFKNQQERCQNLSEKIDKAEQENKSFVIITTEDYQENQIFLNCLRNQWNQFQTNLVLKKAINLMKTKDMNKIISEIKSIFSQNQEIKQIFRWSWQDYINLLRTIEKCKYYIETESTNYLIKSVSNELISWVYSAKNLSYKIKEQTSEKIEKRVDNCKDISGLISNLNNPEKQIRKHTDLNAQNEEFDYALIFIDKLQNIRTCTENWRSGIREKIFFLIWEDN
ncbi:hypothetical protein [Candidatus Mycoplasma haematohominis]|uniref:Uncharacterized protein n=1 Tax=Candidatus Mycoplasma haematohominis TaxID=1494318 RepID=A0A478FUR7_9MOLU|nr:hypothetical protein [Candidatus Mycoplasma haemohominis]GCE63865.1 hypothetical protein MHSWG343_08720 [Candidatus Mycoplasma haemohominis]